MSQHDTIAAIATAPGQGGVGVVRISGQRVPDIATTLLKKLPAPRYAVYADFCSANGNLIDQGIALYFEKPHSFTGEHVLELQGHGGPVVLDRLLQRVIELGARQARAGEFSERAFLNNKIDLVQAEAIADLIAAESEQSARAAVNSLQGKFSENIHALLQQLIQLRMHVESALDFPEEEIDFLTDENINLQLQNIRQKVAHIRQSCQQGALLTEGLRVVITGKPNAGKSSLLNTLAGIDSAIVSDVPGTTRDVLREHIQIEGIPLHIIDTAGMRDATDSVEQEGVRRAQQEIERADIIINVIDSSTNEIPAEKQNQNELRIFNKIDLNADKAEIVEGSVKLSVKTGEGLNLLKQELLKRAGYKQQNTQAEGSFTARRRHLSAIEKTGQHLQHADDALNNNHAGEIMAEELRLAQNALSEITGEFSSDDLLGKIFSSFCIGK